MTITVLDAEGVAALAILLTSWLLVVTILAVRLSRRVRALAAEVKRLRRTRTAGGPRTGAGAATRTTTGALPRIPPGADMTWRPDPNPPTNPTGRHSR